MEMQVDPVRPPGEVLVHQNRIAGDEVAGGGHVDPPLEIEMDRVDAGVENADPHGGGPQLALSPGVIGVNGAHVPLAGEEERGGRRRRALHSTLIGCLDVGDRGWGSELDVEIGNRLYDAPLAYQTRSLGITDHFGV